MEELVIPATRTQVSPKSQLQHWAPFAGSCEAAVWNTVSSLQLLIFIPLN